MQELLAATLEASPLYATPAFPAGNQSDYVNGAFTFSTGLTSESILATLHQVEAEAGRERVLRWGQRTLDLDLIGFDKAVLPDRATWQTWHDLPLDQQKVETPETLILPHPRMQDRAFVLVPLAQIAPDWVHPILGRTVTQLRDACNPDDIAAVKPLD